MNGDRFLPAFSFEVGVEGSTYEDVPGDSGGPTKYGLTYDDIYWAIDNLKWPSNAAVAQLTETSAQQIYYVRYWQGSRASKLTPGFAETVFDIAVNNGIKESGILFQRALNLTLNTDLTIDGNIGPKTLAVAASANSTTLQCLLDLREALYNEIVNNHPEDAKFLKGWINRNNALRQFVGMPVA